MDFLTCISTPKGEGPVPNQDPARGMWDWVLSMSFYYQADAHIGITERERDTMLGHGFGLGNQLTQVGLYVWATNTNMHFRAFTSKLVVAEARRRG